MITPEGKVKVLDFGLAKAFHEEPAVADLSYSPTITEGMTREGVILGTAAYMSREQAKGKPVDKRADIWAWGCVLYECLTGKRAFEGETITGWEKSTVIKTEKEGMNMLKQSKFFYGLISLLFVIILIFFFASCGIDTEDKYTGRDYFKELGIKSFINAGLPYSTLAGAEMWPEVIDAIKYASTRRARMKELHDAAGEKIAFMTDCEAAMVSAGASSAITLGTAACMTGTDRDLIRQLPDARGMKYEVVIQKAHHYTYENAVRCCGAKLVEVETAEELERAITSRTAMMLFYYGREPNGKINAKEFIALGKKHNVPVLFDCATTVPPASNLLKVKELDCDLACFSGGKGLQGPFSAGLLLGRRDLIKAARLNASPNDGTIGRGMKVSKEEILGMMVAVEVSLNRDYKTDVEKGKMWMKQIADQLTDITSLKTEIFVPQNADQMPRLWLTWDDEAIKISPTELKKRLQEGYPIIEIVSFGQSNGQFHISSWMIKKEELDIVAQRIHEELLSALTRS